MLHAKQLIQRERRQNDCHIPPLLQGSMVFRAALIRALGRDLLEDNRRMRIAIIISVTLAVIASGAVSSTGAACGQTKRAPPTYDLYFPNVSVAPDAGISLVRIVISCGHVAAVNRIPDDWYVRTLFPPHESEPEWKEFQFTSSAVDFEAGHGVARLRDLKSLDGAVTVMVDDARCFDIVADIKDDMTEDGWKVRLRKQQVVLRNHHAVAAPPKKIVGREARQRVSQEAFVNQSWRWRSPASTQPFGGSLVRLSPFIRE